MSLGLTLPLASCDPVVEALAAYAAGEGEAAERDAVAHHLDRCDACRDAHAGAAQLRALLTGAAAITGAGGEDDRAATEAGWGRLAAALDAAPQEAEPVTISSAAHPAVTTEPAEEPVTKPLPRRNPWRSWLGAAAAAGFICLTAWGVAQFDDSRTSGPTGPSAHAAPRILEGTMAEAGDESQTPIAALTPGTQAVALADGATVRGADRWTAALESGTTLTANGTGARDTVAISRGHAVWHVVPRTGGLTVTTPHATVRVLGTVFAVQVDADRTVVAVYHGQVRVDGTDVANTVDAGRAVAVAADGAPVVLAAAPAPPEWLRPAAALTATLATVEQSATRVRFTLTNPGPGLCALVAPNTRDPHFSLAASRPGAAGAPDVLQRLSVQPVAGQRAAAGGRVLLGPGESYTVECNIAAALSEPGRYRLTARYAVAGNVPQGSFVGHAESAPVDVELR